MNLCEVLALYGQTLAPDEPVRLLIHHARDFNCSASLAAPMLRSKTVEQAPNPARAPERTQRDTLRRLLPEAVASATDIEIGEAAAASDARKEAEHHQPGAGNRSMISSFCTSTKQVKRPLSQSCLTK